MSFSVTLLLTTGINTGPDFNIYECVNGSCSGTPITQISIVSGEPFVINGITEGTTSLKIESIGDCDNSVVIGIQNIPTPTPSPTSTPDPIIEVTPTPTPTSTPDPIIEVTPSSTPIIEVTPSPTPTSDPIVFSTFYLSMGVLDSNGHCGDNYLTGTPIYVEGEGTTPPFLLNKVAYTDTSLTTVFEGGSLYYFVDNMSGSSTTDFLIQFGKYTVISIDQFGFISDIQDINCSNGGSPL